MTNLEKWNLYMKNVCSPQSFIDMGFYYMITAALQRKVWLQDRDQNAIFPNLFIILVGPPGVGKGMVIKPMSAILRHHKREIPGGEAAQQEAGTTPPAEILDVSQMKSAINADLQQLIRVAPESITYEKLISTMAGAARIHQYFEFDPVKNLNVRKTYMHCSMAFLLEELSSLIKERASAAVAYLTTAFDCGDYTYDTKRSGTDRITKTCLNFFAGTTPSQIQDMFDESIIDDGFAARTLFVYESAARFNKFGYPPFTPEQLEARQDILAHIKKIAGLYGQVTYTGEAFEVFRKYFEEILPYKKVNNNPRLIPYYTRKKVLAQKLAMSVHFADSTDMVIQESSCIRTLEILGELEKRMHMALTFGGANPLAKATNKILAYLKDVEAASYTQLWSEFIGDVNKGELDEILSFLESTDKIRRFERQGDRAADGTAHNYYELVKKEGNN